MSRSFEEARTILKVIRPNVYVVVCKFSGLRKQAIT